MDITVVIPAYNAEKYLAATIESVLAQTLAPERIVVVDDGSKDGTAAVAARYDRVTCVRQANAGVTAARNRGAAETTTRWLAFLDADDLWTPDKLERQAEALERERGKVALTGLRLFEGEPDNIVEDRGLGGARTDLYALLFRVEDIPQGSSSTLLVERALYDAIGGYDRDLATAADWDILVRLRMRAELTYVAAPLVLYRRHASNMSRNVTMLERESPIVLEKAFAAPELPDELRRLRRRCLAWNDVVLSGSHFWGGDRGRALWFGARAAWRDPRLLARLAGFPLRQVARMWRRAPRPGSV